MKNRTYIRTSLAALGMVLLILDSKTVIKSATEGIEICLNLVIPSLFPFIFLSNVLTSVMNRSSSLFAIGMLGGYPAGAQTLRTAYDQGNLSRESAQKMLGYCNLAGPAFIFGMLSPLFAKAYIPWILWGIQITANLIPYFIFRDTKAFKKLCVNKNIPSVSEILLRSIKSISLICGWVFLFRILICVLEVRLFNRFSFIYGALLSGLLEMTNGCCKLYAFPESIRFVLCSGFLGFGGICVLLQTSSIVNDLGIEYYLKGKILHGILSIFLALLFEPIIF